MKFPLLIIAFTFALITAAAQQNNTFVSALNISAKHLENATRSYVYPFRYPRTTNPDGTLKTVESHDWTSGFFPGSLWLMYEYTGEKKWLDRAQKWTMGLEKEKLNKGTHDLGFMLYCSFGNGLRLHENKEYKEILIQGAKSLMTRFNEKTGCLRSWDHGSWQFPVIIDNMMNLELLFWATKVTGDSSFYKVAVTHANTTIANHFREDYSSYHVVDYDTTTGKVISRGTHQGLSDESAWSRGQSWALYGYTMAYRETQDRRYLQQAEGIASFIAGHPNLPKDKIPYWDYNVTATGTEPRDASAASIAASALLELANYSGNGKKWKDLGYAILKSLSSERYLAKPGTNNHFLLMHSVGHKPAKSEIDVPLVYADYYFIEALLRATQEKRR